MEVGLVRKIDIDQEMQQAYLDYAMSVIVSRALPDARDGLKPVHRRILYAMYDMGLRPDSAYKKSARIVGEVLGKYHPHGDAAVYDAMARMAQEFSMRYPLVDGQGNFGSIDGDPPAAMRYTEARLAAPAIDMLADIHKNTVDFDNNFDDSLREPTTLPASLPNLLINGTTGIAVGMSTNIPPHNLGEVIDALTFMLDRWDHLEDINVEDLMRFIQGPDFPTGGVIIQDSEGDDLNSAYGSGKGRITLQARARVEEMDRSRKRIIVSELPYQVNKAGLVERIARLTREEQVEGITDLRDESDREGMRIVIELTKNADPEVVLQELYRRTPLRTTFGVIMLALVDGEPRLLSLKQALRVYVEHRLAVIRRRSQFDLDRARQREHVLEGLRVALRNLDQVIALIRNARTVDSARTQLRRRFKLSEVQSQAILDMPLRRLAALERKKIDLEYKDVQTSIKNLQALLRSPKKQRELVATELRAVKEAYGDQRRTQIVRLQAGETEASLLTAKDLTPEKAIWVSVTPEGLIARTPENRPHRLSGRSAPMLVLKAHTIDTLYLVNQEGEAAAVAVHVIPETTSADEGVPFWRVSALRESVPLAAIFNLPPKEEAADDWYVITVTREGMVKKSLTGELPGPSARPFTLGKVNPGDRLGWVRLSDGSADILLVTASGMGIRFRESEVRPMGLVAAGVLGIRLKTGDHVIGCELLPQRGEIFLLRTDGQAKRVKPAQFPRQGRYGQGVISWKLPSSVRLVGITAGKGTARLTAHRDKLSARTIRLDSAPLRDRSGRGGSVVEVKAGDRVVALTAPWDPPRPLAGRPAKGGRRAPG